MMIKLYISFFFFLCAVVYIRKYMNPVLKEKFFIVFLYLVFIVSTVFFIGSNYFTGVGVNESVIYTIFSDLKGAGLQKYIFPFLLLLIFTLLLTFVSIRFSFLDNKGRYNFSLKKYTVFFILFACAFLENPGITGVYGIISSRISGDEGDFSKYYYQGNKKNISSQEKYNLYLR